MDDFEDIRPYHDHEVRPAVQALLADLELARAMAKFKFPRLYRYAPTLTAKMVRLMLCQELKHLDSIHDVQIVIEKYLDKLIEGTSNGLTSSGLEKLDPNKSYLFISNHRDITLDPALVNYMLYHNGFDTVQIAIGDNLLKRDFLTHLMKLNKSFIVKRSLQGREKLKASKQLSSYIHHCIESGQHVWIAQREGRAKDGIDRTEAAILTMLHMKDRAGDTPLSLDESMNKLHIVPVAISYEFDPCDEAKAEELHAISTQGTFQKSEDSDVQSILQGMVGNKGAIHVAFGECLQLQAEVTNEEVACLIDKQVVAMYKLHLVNYLAMEQLQQDFMDFSTLPERFSVSAAEVENKRREFMQRLQGYAPELRPYVLNMYANPVIRKYEHAA